MKHSKFILKITLLVVVMLAVVALVACDDAEPESDINGLYYWHLDKYETNTEIVESYGIYGDAQRYKSYIYFINGSETQEYADNTWGVPVRNAIVRASFNREGNYSDPVVIVPKRVLTKNEGGGFAIIYDWIYYATPSINSDGSVSTTHIDFMRTRIDAKVTTLLATVEGRDIDYYFTPTRVFYKRASHSTVNYIDFSAVDDSQSSNDGAGIVHDVFLENVETVKWIYSQMSKYIYYTTKTGDVGSKFYNTLNRILPDGTGQEVLIDENSYSSTKDDGDSNKNTFRIDLIDLEHSGSEGHLIYTKTSLNDGQEKLEGFFVCAIKESYELDLVHERCLLKEEVLNDVELNSVYYYTNMYGGSGDAIVTKSDGKVYFIDIRNEGNSEKLLIDEEVKFVCVTNSNILYIDAENRLWIQCDTSVFLNKRRIVLDDTTDIDLNRTKIVSYYFGWFTSVDYLMYVDKNTGKSKIISLEDLYGWYSNGDGEEIFEEVTSYEIGI